MRQSWWLNEENLARLATTHREVIRKVEVIDSHQRIVLDMYSIEVPAHDQQNDSAYTGHVVPVALRAIPARRVRGSEETT